MLMVLLLNCDVTVAQEPRVSAAVDSTHYRIGDWIRVNVTADVPSSVESLQPALHDSLGDFEVMKVEERSRNSWMIQFTSFDTGRVVLPSIQFSYVLSGDTTRRTASSNPLLLTIAAPVVNLQEDIRDIKPPLDAPWLFEDFRPYLIALAIILLSIAAYYYWRKKFRKEEKAFIPSRPAIPPHTLALMQLRDLEEKRLWQQGKVKQYYSEVTEIIRRFFEGRFGILALEMTSDEVLQSLKLLAETEPVRKQLLTFFTTADLVKFAKYEPTPAEHELELKIAYDVVRALVPQTKVGVEKEEVADAR
jgi:hypothetical protein